MLADRAPHAEVVLEGELLDLLDGGFADSARRRIDDAQQADGIVRAADDLQVARMSFTSAR